MPVIRRKLYSSAPPAVSAGSAAPVSFPTQRLLRIPQAAQYLGASVWSVRDLLRRKELIKIRLGRKFLIDIADLDAWILSAKRAGAS